MKRYLREGDIVEGELVHIGPGLTFTIETASGKREVYSMGLRLVFDLHKLIEKWGYLKIKITVGKHGPIVERVKDEEVG